jgi:hypothetical protein
MDALDRVHNILERPFWPKHLEIGGEYRLQADDQDGREDTGWMTINLIGPDTISVQAVTRQPALEGDARSFRLTPTVVTFSRADGHALVHQALLYLALAFRADSVPQYSDRFHSLVKTRSRWLEDVYSLLDCTPWLYSLECDKDYTVKDIEGTELTVVHTPLNDSYLIIGEWPGKFVGRIRGYSGGGQKYHTYSALKILAEAIRLETERG